MNTRSFFNASTGFDACYVASDEVVEPKLDLLNPPIDLIEGDKTVLQADFLKKLKRVESPFHFVAQSEQNALDESGLATAEASYKFRLEGVTKLKDITLDYVLGINALNVGNASNRGIQAIDKFTQTEYALLDYIQEIRVYLGNDSNPVIINTGMTFTSAIKRWAQSIPKSETEAKIAGQFGFSNSITRGQVINQSNTPELEGMVGYQEVVQYKAFKALMDPFLKQIVETKDPNIAANHIAKKLRCSVPLWLICPFFCQEEVFLPRNLPIQIDIKFRQLLTDYNLRTRPQYSTFGQIEVSDQFGLNLSLTTDETIPTITYHYNVTNFDTSLNNSMALQPIRYNFFSFQHKRFVLNRSVNKVETNFNQNQVVPLELWVDMEINDTRSTSFGTYIYPVPSPSIKQWGIKKYSPIAFYIESFEAQANGKTLRKWDSQLSSTNIIKFGVNSDVIMDSMDEVRNNSDLSTQNRLSRAGYLNGLSTSYYRINLANGTLFKRFMRPNVDGITNLTFEMTFKGYGNFELSQYRTINGANDNPYDESRDNFVCFLWLKYVTQLLIDSDFNIVLVDAPTIST